jgi:3-oxoadipate enol-lactonase
MAFIDVRGTSLRYWLDGTGPSVVLLHELGGSIESWERVAPGLVDRFRVLCYDQRGFGRSEKVRAPYSLDTLVDDFEGIVGALGLPPPYRVVAVAAASATALRLIQRAHQNVAALVLCNPAPGVDAARSAALEAVAAEAEREGMRAILPAMLDKSYPPELSDRQTYESYRGRYVANDPVGFAHAFRILARTDMRPMLSGIACPTMVIAGSKDTVRLPEVTAEVASRIPGARLETIDAGHFMPTTNPAGLLSLLRKFLR